MAVDPQLQRFAIMSQLGTPNHPTSTHVVIESLRNELITIDDAMLVFEMMYMGHVDPFCNSVADVEQYLQDQIDEFGSLQPDREFIDFELCGNCSKLIVWDNETEDYRHLVLNLDCSLAD